MSASISRAASRNLERAGIDACDLKFKQRAILARNSTAARRWLSAGAVATVMTTKASWRDRA